MVEHVPLGSVWEETLRLKGSRGIMLKASPCGAHGELKGGIASSFQALNMRELRKGQEEDRWLSESFLQERQEMAGTQMAVKMWKKGRSWRKRRKPGFCEHLAMQSK